MEIWNILTLLFWHLKQSTGLFFINQFLLQETDLFINIFDWKVVALAAKNVIWTLVKLVEKY